MYLSLQIWVKKFEYGVQNVALNLKSKKSQENKRRSACWENIVPVNYQYQDYLDIECIRFSFSNINDGSLYYYQDFIRR